MMIAQQHVSELNGREVRATITVRSYHDEGGFIAVRTIHRDYWSPLPKNWYGQ